MQRTCELLWHILRGVVSAVSQSSAQRMFGWVLLSTQTLELTSSVDDLDSDGFLNRENANDALLRMRTNDTNLIVLYITIH